MATHMECVGCPVGSEQAFVALALAAAQRAVVRPIGEVSYLHWSDACGAELWLQVRGGQIFGMNPHFAGRGRLRIGLTAEVRHPEDTALDGARHAWVDPTEHGDGLFPFVFAVPDAACAPVCGTATVQVAAFAEEIACWDNEEAYLAAPEELPLATEAFIPSGLFVPSGVTPEPRALFTGRVRAVERHRHPLGGGDFYALWVQTLGGTVDVVTPVGALEPSVGDIVKVSAWLSGRVLPVQREQD